MPGMKHGLVDGHRDHLAGPKRAHRAGRDGKDPRVLLPTGPRFLGVSDAILLSPALRAHQQKVGGRGTGERQGDGDRHEREAQAHSFSSEPGRVKASTFANGTAARARSSPDALLTCMTGCAPRVGSSAGYSQTVALSETVSMKNAV